MTDQLPAGPASAPREPPIDQLAWRIVHEHGPRWWNEYSRRYPNSQGSEYIRREEMARYCVAAALAAQPSRALHALLTACLDAQANGEPLPAAIDAATLAAERAAPAAQPSAAERQLYCGQCTTPNQCKFGKCKLHGNADKLRARATEGSTPQLGDAERLAAARAQGERDGIEKAVAVCNGRSAWAESNISDDADEIWASYSHACDDCAELVRALVGPEPQEDKHD